MHQGSMPSEFHSAAIGPAGEATFGDPDRLFPYWSFTKTAIAIVALRLWEEGALDLDARLRGEPFTLRQLLQHTAGLADYGALPAYHRAVAADEEPWPRADLVATVRAAGPLFAPGEGWAYSNVGMLLTRMAIESAAGQDLAALVEALIARPLGLDSVRLAATREDMRGLPSPGAARYHPGWVYHGCLLGTARDAARLLHGLFGPLLGAAARAQMLAVHPVSGAIAGRPWSECGYGLGLMNGRMGAAGRAIGHSGGGPFSVNAVYHFPDRAGVTVASFADGPDEGRPEFEVCRIAEALSASA